MDLRPTPYDHPDAVTLTVRAQRYYVEIYGGPDDDPLTAADFAPPRGGFLVGYEGDVPVAMGGWLFHAETPRRDDAQIRRMYVDPAVRSRGLGRQLLAALEADATAGGATRLVLTTGLPQKEAVALYRAAGYVEIEPFGYYGGTPGAICLGKRLGDQRLDGSHGSAAGAGLRPTS